MAQHAFSTFLYGMIGYALMLSIFLGCLSTGVLRFIPAEVLADNLEPTIRGWLDDSGLSTKPASAPTWNFGLLTTLPDGESIYIIHMKEHRRLIAFQANLALSTEHQAILKAMPEAYVEKLAQDVSLKLFLAKMVPAIRMRLSDVWLFSKLAITTGLTEEEFLKHLDDMDSAIILARNTISLGVERAQGLVSRRDIRMAENS